MPTTPFHRQFLCATCYRPIAGCMHGDFVVELIASCAWCDHQPKPPKPPAKTPRRGASK